MGQTIVNHKIFIPVIFAVLFAGVIGSQEAMAGGCFGPDSAQKDFAGDFAVSNWTEDLDGGTGFVDTSGAPNFISITGSNSFPEGPINGLVDTDFTIQICEDGYLMFDWSYFTEDFSPQFDPAGFKINGDFTEITDPLGPIAQGGWETVGVEAGDVFGFTLRSIDDSLGEGVITNIFNFQYIPQILYGAAHLGEGTGPSTLYIIDKHTGAPTEVGPINFERCSGIDFDPATGILYGSCTEDFVDDNEEATTRSVLIEIENICYYSLT